MRPDDTTYTPIELIGIGIVIVICLVIPAPAVVAAILGVLALHPRGMGS